MIRLEMSGGASKKKAGKAGKATAAPAIAQPRNPALEEAIRMNREDPSAYAVYADWLQSNGSALGELIILEQALAKDAAKPGKAKKPDPEKRKRATAIRKTLGLPSKDLAQIGWREGMWRVLRLDNNVDWMDDAFDAVTVARPLFESPLCSALEELRLGILRWAHNHEDIPAVLLEAGKHAWARDLARLHLGDKGDDVDMAHQVIGDVGKVITKSFPNLTWLELTSGDQSWNGGSESFGIGPLALPQLDTLVIETCSLSKKRLEHVLEAELPRLETLEVWFGSSDQGAATLEDLVPLLDGTVHSKVVHLGLRNASFTDPLARALPTSKVAARLESIDLSMGTMSDEGATALAAGAKAFPHLKTLSIDDNFLQPAIVRAVKAAFQGVTVVSKTQKDVDDSVEGEIHMQPSFRSPWCGCGTAHASREAVPDEPVAVSE